MRDAGRRPMGRLFYWTAIFVIAAAGFRLSAYGVAPQSGTTTTTVSDSVFMADGTPASGTLIVTWPSFTTASGTAIAGGSTNVTLGAGGALTVELVPNAGATPAGVYYTVIYQLGAGQVKTETWVVPTNSPVDLAAVRNTPGAGLAGQPASIQYVNSELATKANDSAVVHIGGSEIISGDVSFTGGCTGIIGGLYAGSVSASECLAGFRVTPNGAGSNIQAVINGSATGPVVTTTSGHRYVLTTCIYSQQIYRTGETYHSSIHSAGDGLGGAAIAADVRFLLEVQDINPSVPATIVAAPTVLYDDVIANAAQFCTYTLVNAINMQCSIAFPYATHISLAEVRMALPHASYATQIVGSISDGAQCSIASSTTLDFFPQYVPPLNTLIVASYRGSGRAVAEVVNAASIAALASGGDDGVRGIVRTMK